MKPRFFVLATCLFLLSLSACDSAEPDDEHHAGEEELITRLVITFQGGGNTITATATDEDGDGLDLDITPITLSAGVTYTGTIGVFDDLNDENITEEIQEEAEEHQFFFTSGGGVSTRLNVEATDSDANQLPIGLTFSANVTAGPATSGTLRVRLSHYDDIEKDGTTLSDETDIDVTFPVTIE